MGLNIMDTLILAAIITTIIAVIAAGVGIYFAFRGMGYFQYLGGKIPGRISPVRKSTLINSLIALNDSSRPYHVVVGKESDLVAEWKIADASWYGIFSKNKLSTAYKAFLLLDERRHSVRCYEEYRSISWSVGTAGLEPVVHYQKSFFGGRILFKKTYGIGYGFRSSDPRSAGKVYEYRFDVDEIRGQIIATVEANGWEWVPVTGKRNATYLPGTRPDQVVPGNDDYYCMTCGGRLDERTKQCPRCGFTEAIHEEKSQIPVVPSRSPADSQTRDPANTFPSPSIPPSTIPIKKIAIGVIILVVIFFLAFIVTGLFKGPSEKISTYPVVPVTITVSTEPSPVILVPSPTDNVPQNIEVEVQVVKSPINQEISVVFSGGPGQKVLKELEIQVSRSDGQILMANLISQQQAEATISGSKGDDRVEIFALYYSGQKYRIFDEVMKKRVIV